ARPDNPTPQPPPIPHALDREYHRAAVAGVFMAAGPPAAAPHFSAGHDIGTPERDAHLPFERRAGLWWDHSDKEGAESRFARESEVYLGMCRRWRELPKPVVASVQGACVAGGLMLAWICDLIVASEDAFFADPVVRMGIPGVEYFAHPWVMPPRIAKEFLYTGDRMSARRAYEVGMVNRVVPRAELTDSTFELAHRIAEMPRMGLALTKRAVNQAEDLQGLHTGMDAVFGLHHLAHAHNAETAHDALGGMDIHAMLRRSGGRPSRPGEAEA
ncbi:enoyl-CoA hydratase, partial [Streptomyces roseolus]|uniref:enoyl-CoA hydratase n=1 Tax=Streptomyces roseolus TaxID=67358 RepID=UPI003652D353